MLKTRKQREENLQHLWQAFLALAVIASLYLWSRGGRVALVVIVFGLLVFGFILGLLYYRHSRQRRLQACGFADIDRMTGEEFEEFLRALFVSKGYRAQLTKNGADFGADVLLERDGRRTVVQAKHWSKRDVGLRAVQEIVAAKAHYRADDALVVAIGAFTQQAIDLARTNRVELWDRDRLGSELLPGASAQASVGGQASPAAMEAVPLALHRAEARPLCPRCGSEMVQREGRYGRFWGCPDYPGCRGTRQA